VVQHLELLALQHVLAQLRPLVRQQRLVADDRQRTPVALLPEGLDGVRGGQPRPDHDDAFHASHPAAPTGCAGPRRPVPAGPQAGVASAAARAAPGSAASTWATASSSCAAETNHASNADGGRLTPASSIAWKKAG